MREYYFVPLEVANAFALIDIFKSIFAKSISISHGIDDMVNWVARHPAVLDVSAKMVIGTYKKEDDPRAEYYRNITDYKEILNVCVNIVRDFFDAEIGLLKAFKEWASYPRGNFWNVIQNMKKINYNSNEVIPAEALLYRILWKQWQPAIKNLKRYNPPPENQETHNMLITYADAYIQSFRKRVERWRHTVEKENAYTIQKETELYVGEIEKAKKLFIEKTGKSPKDRTSASEDTALRKPLKPMTTKKSFVGKFYIIFFILIIIMSIVLPLIITLIKN